MSKEIDNDVDTSTNTDGNNISDDNNVSNDSNVSDDNNISDSEEQIFDEESVTDAAESEKIFDEEQISQKEDSDTIFETDESQLPPDDSAATTVLTGMPDATGTIFGTQEPDNATAEAETKPDTESQDSKKEEKKSGTKKLSALKIFGIVFAVVIVCTYVAVSVWFMFHYNYKTYINGNDYSFYTLDEVDQYIGEYISDYSLTLKLRYGSEYRIEPDDIGLVISPNITAKKIISEQNGFLWPYYMCKRKDYELYYTADYDKDKLESLLKKCDFTQEANMEKPVDASVVIKDGKSTIIPETEGNYIDFTELCCIIDEALIKGDQLVDLDETDVYEKPEVTADSEEIISEQAKLEKILSMKITYKIDEISWELTSEDYGDWISDISAEKIEFQKDKVHEYVQNMADRYDTYGVPRNFRTHDGRTVTLDNTWYGWLIDVDSEAEELYTVLEAGESVERVPIFDCYAAVYRDGGDDIGDTYIECDFGQQHIYVYVNGEQVMDSDCVTGSLADSGKYRTPGGVYTILYTKTPAVLIGDDYETPVKYWMPFIGELGIGFHDATWRSAFGGDIYKTGGSHGCVNLPLSAAEQLFNIAYEGMPVVCYY